MKKNELTEKILFALGNLVSATEIIFSRESLMKKIQKMGGAPDRRSFLNSFSSLQRSGLWQISKTGNYQITEKGKKRLEKIVLRNNFKKQKWDGFWRMVIFDIAENKKAARESLRRKLNEFGFYPLQKSVFIFPYDCKKEILAIRDFFEANDNIEYLLVKSLGDKEQEIRDYFNI